MVPRIPHELLLAFLAWLLALAGEEARAQSTAPPDSSLRSYNAGAGFLNRGHYDLAIQEFQVFLNAEPRHARAADARYGLGVAAFRANQRALARQSLGGVVDRTDFTFRGEALLLLAQCCLLDNDVSTAINVLDQFLKSYPDHALTDDAAALRIEACWRSEKHAEVAEAATQFLERWKEDALAERVCYFGASSLAALEKFAAAAELLQQLVDRFPKSEFVGRSRLLHGQALARASRAADARRILRQIVDSGPPEHRPAALEELVNLEIAAKQPQIAAQSADEFLRLFPDSDGAAQMQFIRGQLALQLGDAQLARRLLSDAAKNSDARGPAAAWWSAKAALQSGDAASAILELETLRRRGGDALTPALLLDLASAYAAASRDSDVVAATTEVLDDAPEAAISERAIYLRAVSLARQGDFAACARDCALFASCCAQSSLALQMAVLATEATFAQRDFEGVITRVAALSEHSLPADLQRRVVRCQAFAELERGELARARPLLESIVADSEQSESRNAALRALANIAMDEKRWAEAEPLWAAYLKESPSEANRNAALLRLGIARARQQRWSEAAEPLKRVADSDRVSDDRAHARFELGQCLIALERPHDAVPYFESLAQAAANSPFAVAAFEHLADIARRSGDAARAAELLEKLESARGDTGERAGIRVDRAIALVEAKNFSAAEAVLARALADELLPEKRELATAYQVLVQSRLDKHEAAISAFERIRSALDRLPDSLADAVRNEAAWSFRRACDPKNALEQYELLTSREKSSPNLRAAAALAAGKIELEGDRLDAAAKWLQRADSLKASLDADAIADLHYTLGVCDFRLRQFERAIAHLSAFLDARPKDSLAAAALLMRGECRLQSGNLDRAIDDLETALTQTLSESEQAAARLRLADACAQAQRWPRSEQVYVEFLRKHAGHDRIGQARFGIGWALENQQRYAEAIDSYRDVLEQKDSSLAARCQFQIGECLYAQKQYEEATRELLKVDILYSAPEWSAAALYEAGRCFEELGRAAEARDQFKSVVTRFGSARWADLARARLAALNPELPGRN